MKVARLPVDTGTSGWNAILPEEPAKPSLEVDCKADFLVVGGGFAGLSAARRLAQLSPQAKIVVLEAKQVAQGPAGRNSGFMIDLPHELSSSDYASAIDSDRKQIELNRQAIAFAKQTAKEYGLSQEAFNPCGKVNGAHSAAAAQHNHDYATHLDALGETYELLDASRMRALTGSDFYSSGLYTPGTVLLQPALYIRGLAKGISQQVSLFENSPVVSLARENGNWIAKTPSGSVISKKTILATNGHIESFGFFRRQVFHIILYASMSRALNAEEDRASGEQIWGITPSDPAATTMRKIAGTGGTRIITRNQMSYAPTMQTSQSALQKMAARHEQAFAGRYPQLNQVNQEYAWAGRLCLSRNSAPAFGEVDHGLFSACCQNGLGTARGTLSGMAAAEFAVDGRTPLVEGMLKMGNPLKLPPPPLDIIGASAFMQWSQFRARREM